MRDPTSKKADATSQNDQVALAHESSRPNLQSRVYDTLGIEDQYLRVSNDLQSSDSIEALHDTVHNTLGDGGHMSWLSVAAFDPVFWLHHT